MHSVQSANAKELSAAGNTANISNQNIQEKIRTNGPLQVKDSNIHKLRVTGPMQASNLKSEKIKVVGSLQGEEIVSNRVNVQGSSTLAKTTIDQLNVVGRTEIKDNSNINVVQSCGYVRVEDSKVMNLKVDSNKCEIHNSQIGDLTLSDKQTKPTVKISGNSSVKGNIIFESGDGTVLLDKELMKNFDVKKIKGGKVQVIDGSTN
jgi:hypothetical protein